MSNLICPMMSTVIWYETIDSDVTKLVEAECIKERCALWVKEPDSCGCGRYETCDCPQTFTCYCALRGGLR
jgi:hypothetical protein